MGRVKAGLESEVRKELFNFVLLNLNLYAKKLAPFLRIAKSTGQMAVLAIGSMPEKMST